MKKQKVIGIIGGAGVAAGAEIVSRLEQKMTASGAYRDFHHPEVILYQATKAPSRSMFLEEKGETFVPDYIEVAKKLKSIGADFIAMSCNTAHFAIEEIEEGAGISFLNLIKETVLRAKANFYNKKIAVMASEGTNLKNLYEKYFELYYPEATLIKADKKDQEYITQGICNIKKGFHIKTDNPEERPRNLFKKASENFIFRGAEALILGCTEIPLDFDFNINIPVLDTIDVLADACLTYSGYINEN